MPIVVEKRSLDKEEPTYWYGGTPFLRGNPAYVMKGIHFLRGNPAYVMKGIHLLRGNPPKRRKNNMVYALTFTSMRLRGNKTGN